MQIAAAVLKSEISSNGGARQLNVMIKKISLITICIAALAFAVFAAVETMTFSKTLKKEIDSKLFYETKKKYTTRNCG